MKKIFSINFLLGFSLCASAQNVDYSIVSVPEESSVIFQKITNDNDYVCQPQVKRNSSGVNWYSNRIVNVSPDGTKLAYLSFRDNTSNVFIKDIEKNGVSIQRTKRGLITDFVYSPDGQYITFSESIGKTNQIFQTSSTAGYVCRQFTSNAQDYSPVYSVDMKQIYFARQEKSGCGIWSYNIKDNYLSSFSQGMNPCPSKDGQSLYVTRTNATGRGEIWRIGIADGVEECIVSDTQRSFSSPSISPDGKWLLFVGSTGIDVGKTKYWNTDIFVCKTDGSDFAQLTFHASDDLSPVWSSDGKKIYFVSQRGSTNGTANVWCMNFIY